MIHFLAISLPRSNHDYFTLSTSTPIKCTQYTFTHCKHPSIPDSSPSLIHSFIHTLSLFLSVQVSFPWPSSSFSCVFFPCSSSLPSLYLIFSYFSSITIEIRSRNVRSDLDLADQRFHLDNNNHQPDTFLFNQSFKLPLCLVSFPFYFHFTISFPEPLPLLLNFLMKPSCNLYKDTSRKRRMWNERGKRRRGRGWTNERKEERTMG